VCVVCVVCEDVVCVGVGWVWCVCVSVVVCEYATVHRAAYE